MPGRIITLLYNGARARTPLNGPPTLDRLTAAVGSGNVEIVPGSDTIEYAGKVVPASRSATRKPSFTALLRSSYAGFSSQVVRSRTISAGKSPWCWGTPKSWRRQHEPRPGVHHLTGNSLNVAGNAKSAPQWVAFEQRMTELGYQKGKNFIFEFIQVANVDDYALGYRELVTRKVNVLVAIDSEIALKSALAAIDTLPVVMAAIDYDPLSRHYVTSLARPSGNVTGVIFQQIELAAKRIQLIKEAFPGLPARHHVLGRPIRRPMADPQAPTGPPMSLGNMREQGVSHGSIVIHTRFSNGRTVMNWYARGPTIPA